MNWQPIQRLYDEVEVVDTVYDAIDKKHVTPTHFANTELIPGSCCNFAMKVPSGHIIVDDCIKQELNGQTFKTESDWRKKVIDPNYYHQAPQNC